jgi:hypothetical protein
MKLAKFTAIWDHEYSEEEKVANRAIHGDEKDWPESEDDFGDIVIDLRKVVFFNPIPNDSNIRVGVGDNAFVIKMKLDEFSAIMEQLNMEPITDHTKKEDAI